MKIQYTYDKFVLSDILDKDKFKVPQFQRNVVWNSKKRSEFIKTLKNGNPFGSILVYKIDDKSYSLIDGLQRISTIKDYINNPYSYSSYESLDKDIANKIVKYYYETLNISFSEDNNAVIELNNSIRQTIFNELKKGVDEERIKFDVCNIYKLPVKTEIFGFIRDIITEFNNEIKINELLVPAVIYTGPKTELPDIFYNLNTGGVNLSKYETFSSKWDNKLFKIKDDEIITKIVEKYNNLRENSDLDVEVSEEEIRDNGITLFEYCYSISEIIRDKKNNFNILFGENKKSTDPMGFDLLAIICNLPVNKAQDLDDYLMDAKEDFLVDLKDMIIESFRSIKNILSDWVTSLNKTPIVLDSTYMLYHIFMSYVSNNYSIDFKNYVITKNTNKQFNAGFEKYLPYHYLFDYLNDFWKDNRQVSDLTRELNNVDHLLKYSRSISEENWNNLLIKFRNNQLEEVGGKTIPLKAKLFLNYLIKLKVKNNPTNYKYLQEKIGDDNYIVDYEHIVPMKRLVDVVPTSKQRSYPISSVGNLCYLSIKVNRSKKESTLYEDTASRPGYCLDSDYLKFINYPEKQELNFVDLSFVDFDPKYRQFLGERIDELSKEFINELKNRL